MSDIMTQSGRLSYLVEAFKTDSGQYRDLETPPDTEGRRRVLRSLMNIRMPHPLPDEVLRIQDEYLASRAEEKGIVTMDEIPEVQPHIAVWRMTLGNPRAVYACLNYNEAFCPGEIEERSICLDGDSGAVIHGLLPDEQQ